jgi:allophanate hydrolase
VPSTDLRIDTLTASYREGLSTPSALAERLGQAAADPGQEGIWITRSSPEALLAEAETLEARRRAGQDMPLYGIPFAVKDNIDVAGVPTTAACPDYAYQPAASAPVVDRLRAAGALFVGKTNLDQFATGLVGVRSPYGIPTNPFDGRYIVGGSSSGSAAAVSRGLVSFALGTDTAGSGRVPAAFTNVVGWKPSPGLLSTRGVVPACRSLDCLSVFALTVADAALVAAAAAGHDPLDPYSRQEADQRRPPAAVPARFRCAVPRAADLEFFGDQHAARAFAAATERLAGLGAEISEIDLSPFLETAALLYDGPWIAERLAGLEGFVADKPGSILPVTLEILREGARYRGVEVFGGLHRLAALRQAVRPVLARFETLMVPTAPSIYRIDEVLADPRALNARLGRYVSFVNLLDMAGIATPDGMRPDGLPTGVTFLGPWGSDARLGAIAEAFHRAVGGKLGATAAVLERATSADQGGGYADPSILPLAVVGAHLTGLPLNHQLTAIGAQLLRTCRTAAAYRLFALPGTTPPKPGMLRVPPSQASEGTAIEVEVWGVPRAAVGDFLAGVSSPLGLGTVELEDGSKVKGFLCEAGALEGAEDISRFGGWRGFLGRRV